MLVVEIVEDHNLHLWIIAAFLHEMAKPEGQAMF